MKREHWSILLGSEDPFPIRTRVSDKSCYWSRFCLLPIYCNLIKTYCLLFRVGVECVKTTVPKVYSTKVPVWSESDKTSSGKLTFSTTRVDTRENEYCRPSYLYLPIFYGGQVTNYVLLFRRHGKHYLLCNRIRVVR